MDKQAPTLRRNAPGYYTTLDGRFVIQREQFRHSAGWVCRDTRDRHNYSDGLPTLARARAVLAHMLAEVAS